MHNTIEHEDEHNASYNDFYPITCRQGNTRKTFRLKNDGNEHQAENYHKDNEILATIQELYDCFKLGKTVNQYKQLCLIIRPSIMLSNYNKFEVFFIEYETNLLCYREPIQDPCRTEKKICVLLSFFPPLFALANTHSRSSYPGIFEPFKILEKTSFGQDDSNG